MSTAKSARNRKSASAKVVPANADQGAPGLDHLQDFQARALKLVTMFKAVAQLAGDDPYTGRRANYEVRIVAEQGERMAQELCDDVDGFSIDSSKQKREEESHG